MKGLMVEFSRKIGSIKGNEGCNPPCKGLRPFHVICAPNVEQNQEMT